MEALFYEQSFKNIQNICKDINCEYNDKIILYDSVTHGEDNEDSDIDILIINEFVKNHFKLF